MLRYGLMAFLNSQPDMVVCGEADSIEDARNKISDCKPDLLVTALRLGIGDSLEFVKTLKVERPELLILVYAALKESIFAEWALRAGANGYLMKTAAGEELLTAIRNVLRGEIYVSQDIRMRASQKPIRTSRETQASEDLPIIDNLSDREKHLFLLIGSGLSKTKIAHMLRLSLKTTETHRENVIRKLRLNSGRQLTERAIQFVDQNLLPQKSEIAMGRKKKVIPFRAA